MMTNSNSSSSAENPQTPETLDASTPTVDKTSFPLLSDSGSEGDPEEIIMIDPDRPPITATDRKKLKNQLKSKA